MYILFGWAGIAFLIAITAAVVGFTDSAPGAAETARMVFYLIFVLSAPPSDRIHRGQKGHRVCPRLRYQCELRRTVGNDEVGPASADGTTRVQAMNQDKGRTFSKGWTDDCFPRHTLRGSHHI